MEMERTKESVEDNDKWYEANKEKQNNL